MSSNNKPRVEIREVTPEWAQEIMEKHDQSIMSGNFRQRPLNMKAVRKYASDMKAGNWGLSGQGISFDWDDNLLDGQHRLAAVVYCGLPIKMLVMWDLPPTVNSRLKTIDTFDTGKSRNLAQQLKIEGFSYYAEVATTSRMLIWMASLQERPLISSSQGISVANLMKNNILHTIEILRKDNAPKSKFRGSIIAPLVLLGASEPDTSDLFATEFNEMTNLSKTSPVLQFQKFLDRPTTRTFGSDYSMTIMSACASALFSYANDKRVEMIRGNKEHVEWLLKVSKNAVAKIREVGGIELTMEELKQKG